LAAGFGERRCQHEFPLTHRSVLKDRREGHCPATPVG
jgi:hypothetical protein